MDLSINFGTHSINSKTNRITITSFLEPYFDSHEKKKAKSYIGNNRIHIFTDGESMLGAGIEGNQNAYITNFYFDHPPTELWHTSKLEDFKVSVECSCPAFSKYNSCKHIWALACESEDTNFAANFSEIMQERLSINSKDTKKVKKSSQNTGWQKFVSKPQRYFDENSSEHEIFQLNLINKPTPRKYFLALREATDHLKQHRKLSIIYRTVKKSGEFGAYLSSYISNERLNRYPDPNFNIIADAIFKVPYQDTNNYQEEYRLGYNYRYEYLNPGYSPNEIGSIMIKPEYFDILRLSNNMERLCLQDKQMRSESSKQDLEPLVCIEDTWNIKYTLSKKSSGSNSTKKQLGTFEIQACIYNTRNPELKYEDDISTWILNIPSQTILAKNKIILLEPVPLPELALELINSKRKMEITQEEVEDFLISLAENHHLDHFHIPEELLQNIHREEPKAVLMLEYPGKNSQSPMDLCGLLEFEYGIEKITPNDQRKWLPLHENGSDGLPKVIERDLEKEAELLAPLAATIPGMQSAHIHRLSAVSIPVATIFPLIEKLLLAGWEVKLSNQAIRNSSSNAVSVASGIDWFEIKSEVQFDGEVIQIDKLIQAAKENKNFITFNNGKNLGIIPPGLARRLHVLSQLGTIKDGNIRLGSNQAVWIDLLLKDELSDRNDLDDRIEHARKNLSRLSGISPEAPSRSFKGTLRDYQQFGLGWLKTISLSGFGACLADDMGLGKTVQILALLDSEIRKNKSKDRKAKHVPSLIIAPKTLIENWIRECAKFTPKLKAIAYHGQSRKEFKDTLPSYDIILTTYATLARDIIDLKDFQFNFVILDEAQAIKNPHSLSAKSCLLLKSRYRLALTGTPIENSLDDLLSIFEFLNPGMLGQMAKKRLDPGTGGAISIDNTQYLSKGLLPFILRRTKSEVLKELPPKTEQVLYCELTPKQQKLYDKTKEHYKASLSEEIKEKGMLSVKMQFLEALLRLRQICCDPRLINPKLKPEDSTKLVTLIEELEELRAAGKKALIFSQFTSFLKLVGDELKARKFEFDYLDGKTNNRQSLVDTFQNHQGSRFFLISIKAGGVGLNLTTADYCFILDPWWNPAVEAQAIDRAHRIGQENPVFAYKLIAKNSVEEKIISLQEEKKELAEIFTSENTGFIKNLSIKDFEMIFD
jgi:superfamily II DNA or RNA helicase